jgi:hypothetical protein
VIDEIQRESKLFEVLRRAGRGQLAEPLHAFEDGGVPCSHPQRPACFFEGAKFPYRHFTLPRGGISPSGPMRPHGR